MVFVHVLVEESCPDILVLTETWLNQKVLNQDLNLDGFNMFCIDRRSKEGRVVIYVKDTLSAHLIDAVTQPKCFEYIVLKIRPGGNNHFAVIGIYHPPSADSEALEEIWQMNFF